MRELTTENAEEYLRATGRVRPEERVRIQRLAGGVSNEVLYVARENSPGADFVLKQVRAQLKVPDPWFSRLERIFREVDVLRACQSLLAQPDPRPELANAPLARTPEILFEDRAAFAFGMTAAPEAHVVWKTELLAGRLDAGIAASCGRLLGRLHAGSWNQPEIAKALDDREIFDELRLDPYYRKVAEVYPALRPAIDRLLASTWAERWSLVHADFSPKNLLVYPGGLLMVDFETGHYGDPAFDLGFFLTHLVLKVFYHLGSGPDETPQRPDRSAEMLSLVTAFWDEYAATLRTRISPEEFASLVVRTGPHLGGCLLARLAGKSRVEYFSWPERRDAVHALARGYLTEPVDSWREILERLQAQLRRG